MFFQLFSENSPLRKVESKWNMTLKDPEDPKLHLENDKNRLCIYKKKVQLRANQVQ